MGGGRPKQARLARFNALLQSLISIRRLHQLLWFLLSVFVPWTPFSHAALVKIRVRISALLLVSFLLRVVHWPVYWKDTENKSRDYSRNFTFNMAFLCLLRSLLSKFANADT